MSASALGCAQNSDGSLKDASQIVFVDDVDDEHPISGPQSSTPRPLALIFAPKVKPLALTALVVLLVAPGGLLVLLPRPDNKGPFLLDAIKSAQKSRHGAGQPRGEWKQYLSTQLEIKDSILHWRGKNTYLALRRTVRDYLAIQSSSTAAERAFSSGTLTGTKLRNRLSGNGHISAGESAANRMERPLPKVERAGAV